MVFIAIGVLVGPEVLDGIDLSESNLPHEQLIVVAIYLTELSEFAHGLTAAPLAGRYGRYEQHPRDKAPPLESASVKATRVRGPAARPSGVAG